MATPKATQGATPHTHKDDDGKDVPCSNPTFGPFGDKALHGTRLAWGSAKSDPKKRAADDILKVDVWCFSYYMPANAEEASRFLKSKPDNVIDLIGEALKSDARFQSWHENRGGSATVDVLVTQKGQSTPTLFKRQSPAMMELLKAAGHKVEYVERKRKE